MDERAGEALARRGIGKSLFRQVDVLPTGRTIGGGKALFEHETHALTAPLTKTTKVVTPVLAAIALGQLASQFKKKEGNVPNADASDLMKEAAEKIASLEAREHAVKLAFVMVERGKCPAFKTQAELEEKVAMILEKDPKVFEQALALEPIGTQLGTLSHEKTASAEVGSGNSSDAAASRMFHRLSE
jgi:hypothetical protein